ncbi:DUF6252 family protein [Danxiaibacter flavus]|uniref:DUF6252 family protein n=1 Tax=Danxiaibacter flavus TaxID=3049108 RepID=A0ABV3ZMP2_9BACT|nr:DUF6252 family protein [Chitinophagaceae bacterium DXS]
MRFFYVLISLALMLSSCQKEISVEVPNPNQSESDIPAGTFTATIDGKSWIAATDKQDVSIIGGVITIHGVASNGETIALQLIATKPGTYDLSQSSYNVLAYQKENNADDFNYFSNTSEDTALAGGQLIISSIDTVNQTITGKFLGNVYYDEDGSSKKITSGEFNLPYVISMLDNNENASTTDTVSALIGANKWTAATVKSAFIQKQGLVIRALSADQEVSIQFQLAANIKVGSYPLEISSEQTALYTEGKFISNQRAFSPISGTLEILEHNTTSKLLRGTFSFAGLSYNSTEARQITQGYFSVKYQ